MSSYNKGDDTGSYRLAVSPEVPDDGLTPEGRAKVIRQKKSPHVARKKQDLEELKKEVTMEEHRIPLDLLCGQMATDPEMVSAVVHWPRSEPSLPMSRHLFASNYNPFS